MRVWKVLALLLWSAAVSLSGCAGSAAVTKSNIEYGKLSDSRDGQSYRTVVIGNQTWMADNLDYAPSSGGGWCYDNKDASCGVCGRLYDWSAASEVCPSGWHLPSREEWDELIAFAGAGTAGAKLKSADIWRGGNGTDDFGFSALPCGYCGGSNYEGMSENGWWWTSTAANEAAAYYRLMHYGNSEVKDFAVFKVVKMSVRCVKD